MISARTAYLLFAALTVIALLVLQGKALAFTLIVVFALAAKTFVDQMRRE